MGEEVLTKKIQGKSPCQYVFSCTKKKTHRNLEQIMIIENLEQMIIICLWFQLLFFYLPQNCMVQVKMQ